MSIPMTDVARYSTNRESAQAKVVAINGKYSVKVDISIQSCENGERKGFAEILSRGMQGDFGSFEMTYFWQILTQTG